MKIALIGFLVATAIQSVSFAQEAATQELESNQSATSSTKSLAKGENNMSLDEVKPDQEMNKNQITNSRLAAQAGSMNRFSFRLSLGYSGGSIEKPFDRLRPNYRGLPNSPLTDTLIGGDIGGAYRIDAESSLRFTVGVSMRTPFHNTLTEIKNNKRENSGNPQVFNVSTPTLEYNKTFRSGNIMLSPSISYSLATDSYDTDIVGSTGWLSVGTDVVFEIEGSKWMPGIAVAATQSLYDNSSKTFIDLSGDIAPRSNLELGLYPFAEYQFNDTYAFRSVLGFFNFNNYRDQDLSRGQFLRNSSYVSMGLGISPSRDIWVYPNLQFNADNIRSDLTNVGVNTVINL